jgi:hypothetical protein
MAAVGSASTCGTGLGAGNVAGIGSCTFAGLTFSNFTVIATNGPGIAEVDLASASIVGNDVILNFNPNLGINSKGGQITDLHFTFTVSGPVTGADADVSVLNATLGEVICSDPNASGCTGTNVLFAAQVSSLQSADCQGNTKGGTNPPAVCNFGSGVNTAYVFKDIGIAPGGSLTSFNESFYTGVPEPMTLSMMGVGLLGLGLISRRRKQS